METKPSNPKDAIGCKKVPLSVVPIPVMMEVGLGMLEGGCKYGTHNYRVIGVRASVYYNATMRHLGAWWEGENIDPDSQLSHVTKAISSLVVLRDAMMRGMTTDDRPPAILGFVQAMNKQAEEILAKFPDPKDGFFGKDYAPVQYLTDEVKNGE
jgi:hypothetical protein